MDDVPQDSIKYGKREIFFVIRERERKTLKLTVKPNLEVEVIAPLGSELNEIKRKIREKASWIVKQQNFFKEFLPQTPKRNYVNGETHLYLGRQYRLKVIQNHKDEVKLKSGRLLVRTRQSHPLMVEFLLGGWYKTQAERVFSEVIEARLERFKKYQVSKPEFRIKRLEKKWGSCSEKGLLTLNPELIKAPKSCIEYVINHEICHLVEHNHSPAFYKLQESTMPDWEKRKTKLELILV